MKIFDITKRVKLYEETIDNLMEHEYEYYKSICNSYSLNDIAYDVCPRVNYQCRTSLNCNANCYFCIEKDSHYSKKISDDYYINMLDKSLDLLHEKGIYPSVTITGGEPCIYPNLINGILEKLKEKGVRKFNLNSNGIMLSKYLMNIIKKVEMPHLNISLHHYDLDRNRDIFGGTGICLEKLKEIKDSLGCTYNDTTRLRIQCVLMNGEIDSLTEIKKFLDFIKILGFDNVAFRGLSKLRDNGLSQQLHDYCDTKYVDIFKLMNELENDTDFKFNCQNISDHYLYEDWMYNGIDVHFAYSDMDILEKRELLEFDLGLNYAREFVLYEDGNFCGGWNKELKYIM